MGGCGGVVGRKGDVVCALGGMFRWLAAFRILQKDLSEQSL